MKTLRKQRKTSRASLVRALDKNVSELIRKRHNRCVVCHSSENLTNGHLFSRVAYALRWDVTEDGNCHVQCLSCNLRHEYDPYPYFNWYINEFGKAKFDELHRRWSQPVKFKTFELEVMLEGVKAMIKEL